MVALEPVERAQYLSECRVLVLEQLDRMIPRDGPFAPILYDLVRDYPFREAKALRPALAIATCRALGGMLESVLPSAAAIELYHNAFLVHDDVEDGSLLRRDAPTLHRAHGVPIAVNVGDAMLALTLRPLLDNTRTLGLGAALRILDVVATMSVESAEGQALELDWIRRGNFALAEADYLAMVHKKTTWYSFRAPISIGAICAMAAPDVRETLMEFADALGAAFQIQDDILNLEGVETVTGKEHAGDLWEGKRTLILLHALRHASAADAERALEILRKPRPDSVEDRGVPFRAEVLALRASGSLDDHAVARLFAVTGSRADGGAEAKTEADVAFLLGLVRRHGSIDHARATAERLAARAIGTLGGLGDRLPDSVHRRFLEGLVAFVVQRDR